MAWLQKILTINYVDETGRRVQPDTPGAIKKETWSKKYYAVWREGGRTVKVPLTRDKQAAQTRLGQIIRERERGESGLINPHKRHLEKPLSVHIEDYLENVQATTHSLQHQKEVKRILNLFAQSPKVKLLRDVKPDSVLSYLNSLKCKGNTRNMHRRIIVMFMNWLVDVDRIESNPITKRSVRPFKEEGRRSRRALRPDEIQRLLKAIEEYPLLTASVNRGGRNARQAPQARTARLKDKTVSKLKERGRERALIYRLAIVTGLRRGELSRLRVSHLYFDAEPYSKIVLPGELTKNRKPAVIPLTSLVKEMLQAWIKDTNKKPQDKLLNVPSASNLIKIHQAAMAMAGLAYKDEQDRYADFHALRMTACTALRLPSVPPKERQIFMRHNKLELTTELYDDSNMTNRLEAYSKLDNLLFHK